MKKVEQIAQLLDALEPFATFGKSSVPDDAVFIGFLMPAEDYRKAWAVFTKAKHDRR
jgi:hypothetical protein